MESFRADWHVENGEVPDISAEVDVLSGDVFDMVDLHVWLEADARWAQDTHSVHLCLFYEYKSIGINFCHQVVGTSYFSCGC